MEVRVLGDFEVRHDGRAVDLGGPKQRALLAILTAARGRPVAVERLIDQIWGEDPPPAVINSIQAQVAKLRRHVEPDRGPRAQPQALVTRPSGYALLLPDDALDADRFESMVASAQSTESSARAEELLTQALDLWTGAAYGGVVDLSPALAAEAARLEDLRLAAVEQLWTGRIEAGQHVRAAAELRMLVGDHPLRERLWGLLALALYRSDRQAHALEALREVRRHLADELGLDPGEELRRLEESMLQQDRTLLGERPAATEHLVTEELALPGRAEVLARTRVAVDDITRGRGQVVLVTGEPGIGKTRLARAVVEQARALDLEVGWGTWESEGCPPLWGWSQALGSLLGEGSPVARPSAAARDAASATFELAEDLTDALRETGGCVLVLDDVHWADPDSHRLLRRVAATIADVPVLLLVLSRDSVADVDIVLSQTLAALARLDTLRVPLTGLDEEAVAEHVRQSTGIAITDVVAERLRERTDGNPFYLQQLMGELAAAGALENASDRHWATVPAGVRDVVRSRVAALPAPLVVVLSDAAVLGRTFDADVLEEVSTGEVGVVDEALEAALAVGLVEEEGPGRYRFQHALARDAMYVELAGPARSRAHARAAQALEQRRVGRLEAHAAQLAEHYRLAGAAHARSAWTYAVRAADQAGQQGAHADASRLLQSAVALQDDDSLVSDTERELVAMSAGRALHRVARTYEAWGPLMGAASSALARDDAVAAARALLVITEGSVWSWRQPAELDEKAIELWQAILDHLPEQEEGLRALCTAALAVEWLAAPGSGDRAAALVDEALHTARQLSDPGLLIETLNLSHMALHRPDQQLRRLPIADEMVALCQRQRDEISLAGALCRRGVERAETGRWADGVADFKQANELARRHHFAPVLLIAGYALGLATQADGAWEDAVEAIAQIEAFEASMSLGGGGIAVGQLATVRWLQGRLPELELTLRQATSWHPSFRDLHALALVSDGRLDEARSALGTWERQPDISFDYLWVSSTILRAWVWEALGEPGAVAELRAQLTPFADRIAVGGMSAYLFGSVHHTLALLASAAGDLVAAREHGRAALAEHQRLGFGPWESRTKELLGRIEELALQ